MSIETESMMVLQQILQMDDKVLEDGFDDLLALFDASGNFEQAILEKTTYCRANNLTIEDLIEENKIASAELPTEFSTLSEPKKKLIAYLMSSAVRMNDKIIEKGLHPIVKLRVQRLPHNQKLPSYAHLEGDSGMDVFATEDIVIAPHTTIKSGIGVKVIIPLGYELQVRPKSGMSLNQSYHNLFIANSPGTIDANFRNEIEIIMKNMGDTPIAIEKGNKFAQLVMTPVIQAKIEEIEDVNNYPTERKGGFGSTGEK